MNIENLIELLTPRQNEAELEAQLDGFARKYGQIVEAGYVVSVPDNPMGRLGFQVTEVIPELGLDVRPDQLLVHLNTFHTKQGLDDVLNTAARMGAKYLLAVTGDGGGRLPKLSPESLGVDSQSVNSVDLLRYIHRTRPGVFVTGVAFNPYEPLDHEIEKLKHKIEAGAQFVITQPILGGDDRVRAPEPFGKQVVIGAWMSKNIHLLSECVGYTVDGDKPYDPIANLRQLRQEHPDNRFYLSLLGLKTQLPLLNGILRGQSEFLTRGVKR